jgi:hypothetical protein
VISRWVAVISSSGSHANEHAVVDGGVTAQRIALSLGAFDFK